jgi:hypothetical protein
MRWLIPVGVVLMLAGGAGAVAAYVQAASADDPTLATKDADDGVPADQANSTSTGAMILAPLAGLALALGVGCVGVGMGRWNNPVPSDKRTANPWNEQPAEKGGPPTGLV